MIIGGRVDEKLVRRPARFGSPLTSDPEALARLTLELVAVPSVTGDEAALADLVEARCRALPGVARRAPRQRARRARRGAATTRVALVGHLDTVPPWAGHAPRAEGTRVIGRGAADMKGGDAAILAVLERCAHAGSRVVASSTTARRGRTARTASTPCWPSRSCSASPPFAFVGEPTGCTCTPGCVGSVNADVIFHGRTAHSARPWEGDSAILRAAPFLERAARTRTGRSRSTA